VRAPHKYIVSNPGKPEALVISCEQCGFIVFWGIRPENDNREMFRVSLRGCELGAEPVKPVEEKPKELAAEDEFFELSPLNTVVCPYCKHTHEAGTLTICMDGREFWRCRACGKRLRVPLPLVGKRRESPCNEPVGNEMSP